MFAIALSHLRNHADAEEIAQILSSVRIAAWRVSAGLSLATWLHRIAFNLSHNRYWYFFRRRRHDSLSLDPPSAMTTSRPFPT